MGLLQLDRVSRRFGDLTAVDQVSFAARRARTSREVTLQAKGGRPRLVLLMDSTAAGYWTRPAGDSTTYRLENWTVDQLAPADSTLRPRKPSK
jgi:hypothetical protein